MVQNNYLERLRRDEKESKPFIPAFGTVFHLSVWTGILLGLPVALACNVDYPIAGAAIFGMFFVSWMILFAAGVHDCKRGSFRAFLAGALRVLMSISLFFGMLTFVVLKIFVAMH